VFKTQTSDTLSATVAHHLKKIFKNKEKKPAVVEMLI
jgi:hypothetical protein